jgi:parallel beta-helix repeat protein
MHLSRFGASCTRTLLMGLFVCIGASVQAQTGPQPTITCPVSAVSVFPGSSIQSAVDVNPAGATLCIRAGVHSITNAITPKTGTVFVGEYGAILDGSTWTASTPDHVAIIMAHNQDIDLVTIRNLVIRNAKGKRCVHAFWWMSDRWTIEHNEITGCLSGVSVPPRSVLRNNYIHHNGGGDTTGLVPNGGYILTESDDVLIEGNEIAHNGFVQKILGSERVIFRNNHVHHNGMGIWFDGDNVGSIIEGNTVEDNEGEGIFYEVSGQGIIRNNIVRRNGVSCVFISTSRDVDVYGNTCDSNWRGINLFWSCFTSNGYPGDIGHDLRNNSIRDNTITVGTRAGSIASSLSVDGRCTATQAAPYLTNTKGNVWSQNRYTVPAGTDGWWYWNAPKTWAQWQAIPQDAPLGPPPPPNVRITA